MDMAQDRPYSAQTSQRTGSLLGIPPGPKPVPGGVPTMAPAALRTTGADTTAFSGVGCYTGVFPSPRTLAFPHTASGLSSLTSRLVPLAATCGSPTRPAPTTPGAPSAPGPIWPKRRVRLSNPARPYDTWRAFRFWHLRPASPTPPPPLRGSGGLLRRPPPSQTACSASRRTLFAGVNPDLQWLAFLYGPPGA
jgi:hypothetical protein